MQKKLAYTLAEVLITLGIIGVVAALTIPTFIAKHQKRVFITKMKQTYNILYNAIEFSQIENGSLSGWYYPNSNTIPNEDYLKLYVDRYFRPYLKISKDFGYKSYVYTILLSNGMILNFMSDGVQHGDDNVFYYDSIDIIVRNSKTASYDYSKHDMIFRIGPDGFAPFCWGEGVFSYKNIKNRDEIINNYMYGCNKNIPKNRRYNCSALIMYDNWEIKDDYPW